MDDLINEVFDRSWFHNWIVFTFQVSRFDNGTIDDVEALIDVYRNLVRITEVVNHGIRTMDLYGLRDEIYETIQKPLRNANLTKSQWQQILSIIVESSSDTMVTFQNAMMGPLTTDRLFELVTEISNEDNFEYIFNHFGQVTEDQKTRRIHMDLADYYMQKAIFLYKNNYNEQGVQEFRNAIKMLMSYGQRRDRTLSRLLDTIENIYSIDQRVAQESLKKLGSMSVAVVRQTDGKETSYYENDWTQLLCKYEPELALKKFVVDLETYKRSYICENTLGTLVSNWRPLSDSMIGNALFKTMPNKSNDEFLQSYLKNIMIMDKNDELLLVKTSLTDFISKFDYVDGFYKIDERYIQSISEFCLKYKIECNLDKSDDYSVASNNEKKMINQVSEQFSDQGVDGENIYDVLEFLKSFGYSCFLQVLFAESCKLKIQNVALWKIHSFAS